MSSTLECYLSSVMWKSRNQNNETYRLLRLINRYVYQQIECARDTDVLQQHQSFRSILLIFIHGAIRLLYYCCRVAANILHIVTRLNFDIYFRLCMHLYDRVCRSVPIEHCHIIGSIFPQLKQIAKLPYVAIIIITI